jgi:hypothetical protein
VQMVASSSQQGGLFPYEARRGVQVQDDRTHLAGMSSPGTMRLVGALTAQGPALAEVSLFYLASAEQDVTLEWKTPSVTRRGQRSSIEGSGAALFAVESSAGAGEYSTTLEVDSGVELSSSLGYYQDLWSLDPNVLFPGLQDRLTSDPAISPTVLAPGWVVPGPAPRLIVSARPSF